MTSPYGKTGCIQDMDYTISLINFAAKVHKNDVQKNNTLNITDKQTRLTNIDKAVGLSIQKLNVFSGGATKNIDYVLGKLSCQDYCTLRGDATYNNSSASGGLTNEQINQCSCIDPTTSLKEAPLVINNETGRSINAAQCFLSIDNFNKQIDNFNQLYNNELARFPSVSFRLTCNNLPCPSQQPLLSERTPVAK